MSVFCLHCFALSTNPRIIPAEISRYRVTFDVGLIDLTTTNEIANVIRFRQSYAHH